MSDVALILAAGASRRLGRPKQLVIVTGETLVARAVRVAREAGLEPVVVAGCVAEEVTRATDATTVRNTAWESGIGTSIAAGVRAVEERASSITIMTCDQHRIGADELTELARRHADYDIAAANYASVVGVPARFGPACFRALQELESDVGAQELIRNGEFRVVSVPMNGARYDIDEPADLEELP